MVVIIRPCVTHPFPLLWLSQLLILRHGCVVDSVSAIIEAHFDILAPLHSVCPLDTRSESKAAVYCLATVIVCLLPADCALKVHVGYYSIHSHIQVIHSCPGLNVGMQRFYWTAPSNELVQFTTSTAVLLELCYYQNDTDTRVCFAHSPCRLD